MTTEEIIVNAFKDATADFNESLKLMRPYRRNSNEGYCEANFVEYYSHALRKFSFRPFLELPVSGGRVDALFLYESTVLLAEAKQLHPGSVQSIEEQLARLLSLDLPPMFAQYECLTTITNRFHIALCDCWTENERTHWPLHSFLSGYKTERLSIPNGYKNGEYGWLLAYKKVL